MGVHTGSCIEQAGRETGATGNSEWRGMAWGVSAAAAARRAEAAVQRLACGAHHCGGEGEAAVIVAANGVLQGSRAGDQVFSVGGEPPRRHSRRRRRQPAACRCRAPRPLRGSLWHPGLPAHLAQALRDGPVPQALPLVVSQGLRAHDSRILAVFASHGASGCLLSPQQRLCCTSERGECRIALQARGLCPWAVSRHRRVFA